MQHRAPLVIDFVSDPVCPWCYIGFRGLAWANMALSFQYDLTVRYRPYQLDPTTPEAGLNRATTIARKFPDENQRKAIREALEKAMADVGLGFDPEKPARLPNTLNAHRLIRWAVDENKATEVVGATFDAYWQHGEDISSPDVLRQIAADAGMDDDAIAARLKSDEDWRAVKDEADELRAGGVSGVPTFIVNEAIGFAGALPKGELQAAIAQAASETELPAFDE